MRLRAANYTKRVVFPSLVGSLSSFQRDFLSVIVRAGLKPRMELFDPSQGFASGVSSSGTGQSRFMRSCREIAICGFATGSTFGRHGLWISVVPTLTSVKPYSWNGAIVLWMRSLLILGIFSVDQREARMQVSSVHGIVIHASIRRSARPARPPAWRFSRP